MALVHWDPTREISLLQGDMNRLFERFMGDGSPVADRPRRWVPAMDILETDDHFVIRADLPGMDQDDVNVEVVDDTLRITGERRSERRDEAGGFMRLERSYGRFERTLTLPDGVDAEAIDASFDRGVLELKIPKPVASSPRRIEIGSSSRAKEVEGRTTDTREADDQATESKRQGDRVHAHA